MAAQRMGALPLVKHRELTTESWERSSAVCLHLHVPCGVRAFHIEKRAFFKGTSVSRDNYVDRMQS